MPSSDISVTPITEAQVEREVRNAKRALQRARRKLEETKPGALAYVGIYGVDWTNAQGAVGRAQFRLTTAENRLEAVRSQQPERHQGAWS